MEKRIFSEAAYDWLGRATGIAPARLVLSRMKGSTSSSVFLVRGPGDAAARRFVLRVVDNPEWLAEEPDMAAHEAAALGEAQRAGLRAPQIVDYASDDIGFGAPVVLMSFLEGMVELCPSNFRDWLGGLANELASIHRHTADAFPWRFSSWVNRAALAPPPRTTVPHLWEQAIERALGAAPDSRPVFLHRDYHPANVLWRAGRVSGVVDWISACRGPAGVDVAHCRVELAQMFDPEAAQQFLDAYRAVAEGFVYDPYWDLDGLLDVCMPQPEYYTPWREFGLDAIAPEVLQRRVDAYLESVLKTG